MKYYFLIIIGFFLSLYGAINFYIGTLGWKMVGSKVPLLDEKLYWILFCIIVLSVILGRVLSKVLPYSIVNKINLVGSYYIAAMAYFILFIAFTQLMLLVDNWTNFIPRTIKDTRVVWDNIGIFIFGIVVLLLVLGTFIAGDVKVTPYNISIPKSAGSLDHLRITLISDIHLGNIEDGRLQKIVRVINSLNPDLVLIAGDIIENVVPFTKSGMGEEFKKIKSNFGIYAALGNHDYMAGSPQYVSEILEKSGVHVIRDNAVKISDYIFLVGREDKESERMLQKKRKTIEEITKGIDRKLPIIMMDHQPINLEEAEKSGIDLQLSGHTHKGQFFPFNLVTRKVFKAHYGYLKMGRLQLIVSSGASTWGPPVRIATISEVVDLKISFTKTSN